MEQRTITKNAEKCIYFIKEGALEFYLIIPNSRRVALLLNLQTNIDDNSIQNIFASSDKTIIVPKFSSQISLNIVSNSAPIFDNVDNILAQLINFSHKMLTYNRMEVAEEIFITSDNTYQMFTRWFVQKYNGRVKLFTNNVNVVSNNNPAPVMNSNVSTPSNNVPINNAVSSSVTTAINEPLTTQTNIDSASTVTSPPVTEAPTSNTTPVTDNSKKELGFVSYVLLGVLAAVVSLVFLYLII